MNARDEDEHVTVGTDIEPQHHRDDNGPDLEAAANGVYADFLLHIRKCAHCHSGTDCADAKALKRELREARTAALVAEGLR